MSTKAAITLMARANRVAASIARQHVQIHNVTYVNAAPRTYAWHRFYSTEKVQTNDAEPLANASVEELSETTKKLTQEVELLTKDLKTLQEKHDELLDKYKRALADSENLRTRLTKQIADAKIFGIQNFCKDLLEVADTLGHATKAVPQEELNSNKNPHLVNLFEGLSITKAALQQVFKRHGLEALNPIHEKFDPNYHEALFQKEDSTVEPNTVIEVTKLGYKLHERCIRPALVGVSKSS